MKIAVIGAGGIGGYFGSLLAQAGEDVTLIARGRNLDRIQAHGLTIRAGGEGRTVPVRAVGDAAAVGTADLVLVCVKTYDLEGALPLLPPLVGEATRVLPLENGVTAVDVVAGVAGSERTLGGVAYVEAELVAPGVVVKPGPLQRIVFGPLDGAISGRDREIGRALERAEIALEIVEDIRVAMWRKFVFICAMAGLTTLTRGTIGEVLAVPQGRRLFMDAVAEAVAVGRAAGVDLPEDLTAATLAFADGLPPGMRSSMQKDLEEGRRLELDALNGTVVRLAANLGIEVPVNRTIDGALRVTTAPH